MRCSTAILAALVGLVQVSASPMNVMRRGESDSSVPSTPSPTLPGLGSSALSGTGGFPSASPFPSESFSGLPSGIPSASGISLPFPSGTGFPGPSGGCGIPFPSGVSIQFPSGVSIPGGFPRSAAYSAGGGVSGVPVPTACASDGSYSYSYSFPTGVPSDIPTPSVSRPSGTGSSELHPPSFLTTVTGILSATGV